MLKLSVEAENEFHPLKIPISRSKHHKRKSLLPPTPRRFPSSPSERVPQAGSEKTLAGPEVILFCVREGGGSVTGSAAVPAVAPLTLSIPRRCGEGRQRAPNNGLLNE